MSNFKEKANSMNMDTILNFAEVGYRFMEYRKMNKVEDLLDLNLKKEVQ